MSEEMLCCASCIDDRGLRERIIPSFSKQSGACSYCKTENELLIDPLSLRDYFEVLISIYSRDENGKTLVEWFKHDWNMFNHPMMDIANSKMLLSDILDDGDIVRERFSPTDIGQPDRLNLWEEFKNELMFENRFFPEQKMEEDLLKDLLTHLVINPINVSKQWFRARIHRTSEPFSIDQMGAPPKELASQGRANPAGIPYSYLASTYETAVSEIRPHTGEFASVADCQLPDSLEIIDLRNPRSTVSPFLLSDEKKIASLRGDIGFLVQLGNELTRPVVPHAAAIDYIPSQYLCEFIKKCGYHGVIYKSSVGDGTNLALFEPELVVMGNVKRYRVSRVSVDVET
ncbi:MAG TPA: RES family NAD+ phosphorylase [Methylobacter sp.]|jgi:hypothetical protein